MHHIVSQVKFFFHIGAQKNNENPYSYPWHISFKDTIFASHSITKIKLGLSCTHCIVCHNVDRNNNGAMHSNCIACFDYSKEFLVLEFILCFEVTITEKKYNKLYLLSHRLQIDSSVFFCISNKTINKMDF